MVDDKTVPCCTHKVEVVGAGEELGLEVNSEILLIKRHTTQAEMRTFFKLTRPWTHVRYSITKIRVSFGDTAYATAYVIISNIVHNN